MRPTRYILAAALIVGFFAAANTAVSGSTPYADNRAPVELATSTGASFNWAGYVADGGEYTAVSATWTVPQVSTNAPLAADATWVGIGGVDSSDLLQAGTQTLIQSGVTEYEAWYEILPQASQAVPLEVSVGDSMSVALVYLGNARWHVSFADNTTGKGYALDTTYASSFSSAEWVQEMPSMERGTFIPLDDFGSLTFGGASTVKDDQAVGPLEAGAEPLRMVSSAGDTLAQPSTMSTDGAFTVMRTSAVANVLLLRGARRRP